MSSRSPVRAGKKRVLVPKVRLFIDEELASNREIRLSTKQAHYLTHVMRLDVGDALRAFNGRDGEWLVCLAVAGRDDGRVLVQSRLRIQPREAGPWLAFAPVKKDAQDALVSQATELGVERFLPVITCFTSVDRINRDRLRAQVVEAAEQCGRLTLPVITEPWSLIDLLTAWPEDRTLLFANERAAGQPIAEAVRHVSLPGIGVLVGPEGGFSDAERGAILSHRAAVDVALGPRLLRSGTAAVAALACWQALCGDWRPQKQPEGLHVRPEH